MLETRQLRFFVAVAEDLHFTKAADRLHVAQSALSAQVQQLEVQLGARLLARSKRSGVTLTDAGAFFLVEARHALEQVERAEAAARQAGRGELGHVAIGYAASAALSGVLSAAIRAYRAQRAEVTLHLAEMDPPRQLVAITEGRQDVGFLRSQKNYPDGVTASVVKQERLLLALPADHHLTKAHVVEAHEVEALCENFILPRFEESGGYTDYVVDFMSVIRPEPKHIYPVRDFLTAISLVDAGFGIALVTESARSVTVANVVYREIVDYQRVFDFVLAYRTRERAPAVLAFIETCKGLQARSRPEKEPRI
jgi:DNA-binding transcriptional LysR family regulator